MTSGPAKSFPVTRIIAGVLLVAIVLGAHFYLPDQVSSLAADAIRSLHGSGFGVVALIVLKLGAFAGGPVTRYLKAAATTMIIAVVAEAAQIPGGREAEFSDLLIDALGIVGFLGLAAVFNGEFRRKVGAAGAAAVLAVSLPAFVAALGPTVWLSYALVERQQALPQLLSFDAAWERTYATGDVVDFDVIPAPSGWPAGSGNIARLHSSGNSGLMLHLHAYPDWSGYAAVSFMAATTGGETRRIALGLWGQKLTPDTLRGRYYARAKIGPVPRRYCILFAELPDSSSERPFDLRYISHLLVGATKNEVGVTIYVDDFRLETSSENCYSE